MDYKLLENAPLFKDVPPEEINVMLQCLGTEERDYDKGETIFHAGDVIHNIGLEATAGYRLKMMMSGAIKVLWKVLVPALPLRKAMPVFPGNPLWYQPLQQNLPISCF